MTTPTTTTYTLSGRSWLPFAGAVEQARKTLGNPAREPVMSAMGTRIDRAPSTVWEA